MNNMKRFFATGTAIVFLATGLGSYKVSRADSLNNAGNPSPEAALSPENNPSLFKFFEKIKNTNGVDDGVIRKYLGHYGLSDNQLESIALFTRIGVASTDELTALDKSGFLNTRDNMMDVLGAFNITGNAYESAVNDYDTKTDKNQALVDVQATIPEYSKCLPDAESPTMEKDTIMLWYQQDLLAKLLVMNADEADARVKELMDLTQVPVTVDPNTCSPEERELIRKDHNKIILMLNGQSYEIALMDLSYVARTAFIRMLRNSIYVLSHRGIKDMDAAKVWYDAISVYEEQTNMSMAGSITPYDVDTIVR